MNNIDLNEYINKISPVEDSWEDVYDFEVSHIITEARLRGGYTQKELADLINTKQPGIARAEKGNPIPGHDLLKRIARALNTSLVPPKLGPATDPSDTDQYTALFDDYRKYGDYLTKKGNKNTFYEPLNDTTDSQIVRSLVEAV